MSTTQMTPDQWKVTITDQQTVSQFDGRGNPVKFERVTFYVGPFGPFKAEFGTGQDSPPQIQAALTKKKAEVIALHSSI